MQRIYILATGDISKSTLRKAIEAFSEEISSMTSRFENSLSFYLYLFAGGVLFRQALEQWFARVRRRGIIKPAIFATGTT